MLEAIKEMIRIQYLYYKGKFIAYTKKESIKVSKQKLAFVMLAANYDNLGDIAITKAQEEFIRDELPDDYEIVVVPHSKTFNVFVSMRKLMNEDSIITLIGGGNTGTLYEFIEWPRRFILKNFSQCRIISFPQSVYYGTGTIDNVRKEEFKRLCIKCKSLTIVARESQSYNAFKEILGYKVKILLTPDIVFSLQHKRVCTKRSGVGLVLRTDKEKLLTSEVELLITDYCERVFHEVTKNDTCDVIVKGNGYYELEKYISILESKEIIITDRLHGMILAYVTNTPCIVFNNNNNKIRSTYETWLKNQNAILLCEAFSDENIKKLFKNIDAKDCYELLQSFQPLKELIRRCI